ncbi:uncharacterized protein RCO7_14474 [Rhynchosporium graminicola]|uniref:Uncharacterized protein n=1 Tax=Rhynchosporium graminicola TaxID=2792576 RepID=A0A1E1KJP5_9HELO|nr:uncharacterized protein RCO7_14474 [Rhynchosporium commune]
MMLGHYQMVMAVEYDHGVHDIHAKGLAELMDGSNHSPSGF